MNESSGSFYTTLWLHYINLSLICYPVLSGTTVFPVVFFPAQVTAYVSYRFECIFKIREIRDTGVMEYAKRSLHGIATDHAPDDHPVGVF